MSPPNGHSKITHTDKARYLADELEDLDWDETTEVTVPNIIVNVGDTGKHQTVTKKPSDPPSSSKKKFTLAFVDKIPMAWRGPIMLAIIAAVTYLVLKDKVPSPW